MKKQWITGALVSASLLSTLALAGLPAAEVDRLGKDLTPIGAEKAGNKEGTIPEWKGGLTAAPGGFSPSSGYVDPFANDKPLFTINAANMAQYKDKLAPGQMELMKRYPSYKMNVYPTQRTAAYRQSVYDAAKAEASKVELAAGGNGVLNSGKSNVPFPIPKTGIEVVWNHLMRDLGGSFVRNSADIPVQTNGSFTVGTRTETVAFATSMEKPEPNRILYYLQVLTAPSNVAGEALLVHEPIDQVKESRQAWSYNPGQRRVIKAPELAYDSPGIGVDGLRTNDDLNAYNGAPDRYEWKLIGKKEMYVPYNNYKLADRKLKYTDIIKPQNINADLTRYELHRVWVVEGNLKAGARHIYKKRVFFIDEDSWSILHADQYDGRGELWRIREVFLSQAYDVPVPVPSAEVLYDLTARRYLVGGLTNQEKIQKFGIKLGVGDFSPDALRRLGN